MNRCGNQSQVYNVQMFSGENNYKYVVPSLREEKQPANVVSKKDRKRE